jgi:hypothetical protein
VIGWQMMTDLNGCTRAMGARMDCILHVPLPFACRLGFLLPQDRHACFARAVIYGDSI